MDIEIRGTTVVALLYREGAMIAADMQGTWMPMMDKLHEDFKKLEQVGHHSVIGFAGVPSVGLKIIRNTKMVFDLWKHLHEKSITPDGQFQLLLNSLPAPANANLQISFILATFDTEYGRGRIFQIEPSIQLESVGYIAIGSGARAAINWMQGEKYSRTSSADKAVCTIRKALTLSHETNAGVGDRYLAYRVDENGVRDISSEINSGEIPHG